MRLGVDVFWGVVVVDVGNVVEIDDSRSDST